jgi:uncharacterized membrane protein
MELILDLFRVLPLAFAVLAVVCVLVAALIPVSRSKGRIRLLGSCWIGLAFLIGSSAQIIAEINFGREFWFLLVAYF